MFPEIAQVHVIYIHIDMHAQYRYRAGQEACDDGDSQSDDGCSSTCSIECGYDCAGGTATSADNCTSVCGDGIKTASEACDDNNSGENDGCSSACILEAGYSCSTPDCAVSVCGTVCGDGYDCIHKYLLILLGCSLVDVCVGAREILNRMRVRTALLPQRDAKERNSG